jgi:hypothetical protein
MSHYTKIDGVHDSDELRPGMAFFLGSGPAGQTCGSCRHRGYSYEKPTKNRKTGKTELKGVRTFGCAMYHKLSAGKHGDPVDRRWAACKYWEGKSHASPSR